MIQDADADGSSLFTMADGGVLKTSGKLDRETSKYYDVVVKAQDMGEPPKSAVRTVRVGVTDVNDNSPVCDPDDTKEELKSNAKIGDEVNMKLIKN